VSLSPNASIRTVDAPAVSAGFDAADGDDLGECHVTPAGYAHMTSMLCSLANGRVVVALEVFGILLPPDYLRDRSAGGLQPGINLEFGIGGNEGLTGRPTPSTTPALPMRGGLEDSLGGWYGTEPVLEVYEPENACSQER